MKSSVESVLSMLENSEKIYDPEQDYTAQEIYSLIDSLNKRWGVPFAVESVLTGFISNLKKNHLYFLVGVVE